MSFSLRKLGRYDYASFLTYMAYSSSSLIIPVVLVEIAAALHFPLTEGGQGAGGALQVGRCIAMVAALLLCGFIAGIWGKRRSMGFSVILMAGGVALAAIAPSYGVLFIALVIAGIGEGTVEGLATPVLQELHEDDEPSRYVSFGHAFWSIGIVAMTILVGYLLHQKINWRYIVAGVAVMSLLPALMFLLPGKKVFRREKVDIKTVWQHSVDIMRNKRFWIFFLILFFAGGGEFGMTFWVSSFIRLEFGGTAIQGALGIMIFSIGMIIGRLGFAALIPQRYLFTLLISTSAGGVLIGCLVPFVTSIWLCYVLMLLLGVASAPLWPSGQSYCVVRMPYIDSTVAFIILSAAGTPGCGIMTWLLGFLGDKIQLRYSVLLVPLCYTIVAALLLLERKLWPPEKTER